jgi:hypothetical protein
MLLLFIGFADTYGEVYGYSFKFPENMRTDANYYVNQEFSVPHIGRLFPLFFILSFGDIIGVYLIWMVCFALTALGLFKIFRRIRKSSEISFFDEAIILLSVFLIFFYMITLGYYSQMFAIAFVVLLFAYKNYKYQLPMLFLILFSHPKGLFIVFSSLLAMTLPKYRIKPSSFFMYYSIIAGVIIAFLTGNIVPIMIYFMYIFPKLMSFLSFGGLRIFYFTLPDIKWMIFGSILLMAIDPNVRTIFLAIILMVPLVPMMISKSSHSVRFFFVVFFLIELAMSILWTFDFYMSTYVL